MHRLRDVHRLLELTVHHPGVLDDGHPLILWEGVHPLDGARAFHTLGGRGLHACIGYEEVDIMLEMFLKDPYNDMQICWMVYVPLQVIPDSVTYLHARQDHAISWGLLPDVGFQPMGYDFVPSSVGTGQGMRTESIPCTES